MHHDKKVGLGLGILLIGVVGAFFFRNETPQTDDLPELLSASELDRQIDQPRFAGPKPYTDLDRFEAKHKSGVHLEGIEPNPTSVPVKPPVVREDFDKEFSFLNDPVTTPPNPIPTEPAVSPPTNPVKESTISERKPMNPPAELPSASEMFAEELPSSPTSAAELYEVRPGDTLSEIASRTLGSQARYHLIFEANRDQLSSPNDLKPGMKLRIPRGASVSPTTPEVTSSRVPKRIPLGIERDSIPIESAPLTNASPVQLEQNLSDIPADKPALKFERVQRNPLIPRRTKPADEQRAPSSNGKPSAKLPVESPAQQPVSSQTFPQVSPEKRPASETKKTLPSLDGLEPLRIPSNATY